MRVLLDENLPRRLTREFDDDLEVWTVGQQGWKGKENGELLRAAEKEFDVFITTDQGIPHQQNLSQTELSVVILRTRSNRLSDLIPSMATVNGRIRGLAAGDVIEVAL